MPRPPASSSRSRPGRRRYPTSRCRPEHEHDHERRKRDYLRDDVLQNTGSAITWWLARKDNDVEDTVRLIGALAQLSAAHLPGRAHPRKYWTLPGSSGDPATL
ncbi:MAG: hypothetical protein ACRDSR_02850 [Pseudonocardiaceae bacterium]